MFERHLDLVERHLQALRRSLADLEKHPTIRLLREQTQELAQRPAALVAAGVVILAVGSLFGGLLGSAFSSDRAGEAALARLEAEQAAPSGDEVVRKSLAALRERLETSGPEGVHLRIADGRILAEGQLSGAELDRWHELRAWYDTTHGNTVLLVSAVGQGEASVGPDLRIAAVWAGEAPYILTSRGMRYFEGSVLHDSWHVTRITQASVELRRGAERYLIDLTGGAEPPMLPDG